MLTESRSEVPSGINVCRGQACLPMVGFMHCANIIAMGPLVAFKRHGDDSIKHFMMRLISAGKYVYILNVVIFVATVCMQIFPIDFHAYSMQLPRQQANQSTCLLRWTRVCQIDVMVNFIKV
jgi:hypothetical protein